MVLPSPGQKGRWQNNSLIVLVKLAHIITAESSVSIVLDLAPAKMNLFFFFIWETKASGFKTIIPHDAAVSVVADLPVAVAARGGLLLGAWN